MDIKRTAMRAGLLVALTVPALTGLTGCTQFGTFELPNITGSKQKLTVGDSRHVEETDRDNYSVVTDSTGKEYATVIMASTHDGSKLNPQDLTKVLNDNSFNWYQAICGNNTKNGQDEKAYVFMPASASYDDCSLVATTLQNNGYTAHLMTKDEYIQNKDSTDYNNVFYNESTFMGPASQTQQSNQ